jgi:hypothetical protein
MMISIRPFNLIFTTIILFVVFSVISDFSVTAQETKRIPFIYSTDLFQPPDDPDDHYDLAILSCLQELELKAFIFDLASSKRNAEEIGITALQQISKITGQPIPPHKIGLRYPLRSPEDQALDQPEEFQAGVQLILSTLQNSNEPVVMFLVGSCRDFTVAFNRQPDLLRKKVKAIYVNAGNGPGGNQTEWNVKLDPNAYIGLMKSGLPIYWCPCCVSTHGGKCSSKEVIAGKAYATFFIVPNQAKLLESSRKELKNFFAYALSRSHEEPLSFLEKELQPLPESPRNMWCTGPFLHAAGRKIYPTDNKQSDNKQWIACTPEKAKSLGITVSPIDVFKFEPILLESVAEKTKKEFVSETNPCQFLGNTQDKVGKNDWKPDGISDHHIRINGIDTKKEINKVVITASKNAHWESMPTEKWWRIAVEKNDNQINCFFSPYTDGIHEIVISYLDGTSQSYSCNVTRFPVFYNTVNVAESSTKVFRYVHPDFNSIMSTVLSDMLNKL